VALGPDLHHLRVVLGMDTLRANRYLIEENERHYDAKAAVTVAYRALHPGEPLLEPGDFTGDRRTIRRPLEELGFRIVEIDRAAQTTSVETERARREDLWARAQAEGDTQAIAPGKLRALGLNGGAQGIWVDAARTRGLAEAPHGVTVAVMHTGRSYADDLTVDGLLYHYPTTGRNRGRDDSEISATKSAALLGLPIFVIKADRPQLSP
jgi:putative restriction endonuclease